MAMSWRWQIWRTNVTTLSEADAQSIDEMNQHDQIISQLKEHNEEMVKATTEANDAHDVALKWTEKVEAEVDETKRSLGAME